MLRQFAIALSFLTLFRLPISGEVSADDSGRCYAHFPVVGLLIGGITAIMVLLLRNVIPPLLLAGWVCGLMAFITRGFHLDGLADLADGLGGGYTPARRLEIMKDSATGALGAIALVLAIVIKTSAIYTLITAKSLPALVIVPALSRFAIVACAYGSSCARDGGLAKSSAENITRGAVFAAGSFAVVFALVLVPKFAPLYLATAVICALLLRHVVNRQLGGITGDVLGAVNELTEIVLFTLSACLAY